MVLTFSYKAIEILAFVQFVELPNPQELSHKRRPLIIGLDCTVNLLQSWNPQHNI